MDSNFDGITAREERLRKLQAGIPSAEAKAGGSKMQISALSPQAAQVLSDVRRSSAPQPTSLPPKRASELSDKSAELIALVMRDMMHS
ncbi:MAG: hypothetical protein FWB85_11070 [Chitinispirillia bacterium]|nr:hypothetical protein [Chitinispirillia bacterium]MCL2242689.1 hypothetical protein [Chitinispirillia bacterium]